MAVFSRIKMLAGLDDAGDDSSLPFSLVAAATTNATLVKNSSGIVLSIHAINVNAAVRYLKFYDLPYTPTAGGLGIVRRYGIPGATTGAGFVYTPNLPLRFTKGIGLTLVTGSADTDATALTAGDVILTIEYL